jgi:hypothetical protein
MKHFLPFDEVLRETGCNFHSMPKIYLFLLKLNILQKLLFMVYNCIFKICAVFAAFRYKFRAASSRYFEFPVSAYLSYAASEGAYKGGELSLGKFAQTYIYSKV